MAEHVARIGERKGLFRILVEKPERKRPLRRTMHKCKDDIKTDPQVVRWEGHGLD